MRATLSGEEALPGGGTFDGPMLIREGGRQFTCAAASFGGGDVVGSSASSGKVGQGVGTLVQRDASVARDPGELEHARMFTDPSAECGQRRRTIHPRLDRRRFHRPSRLPAS